MAKRKRVADDDAAAADVDAAANGDRDESTAGEPSAKEARAAKKRVRFDGVTAFYFQRSQGFTSVPSFGGSSLGMLHEHHAVRMFSLSEYESERVLRYRQMALQNSASTTIDKGASISPDDSDQNTTLDGTDDDEEEEEEEEEADEEDELEPGEVAGADAMSDASDGDDAYFLQPMGAKWRRALLRSSGVRVDGAEGRDCQAIRQSRQSCGCSCAGVCRADTCECARFQIQCQADRPSFPCGCAPDGCGNPEGRVEFNPGRVRTHYMQTMLRLRMADRQPDGLVPPSPTYVRLDGRVDSYCAPPAAATPIPGVHTVYPVAGWCLDASLDSGYEGSPVMPLSGDGAAAFPLASLYDHQKHSVAVPVDQPPLH